MGSETRSYTYDAVGNRLTMSQGSDSYAYAYDATGYNRLTSVSKNGLSEYTTYTYDGRGNQTSKGENAGTSNYSYNLKNQLAGVSRTAGSTTTQIEANMYNASGQRVKRVENGETTKYYT